MGSFIGVRSLASIVATNDKENEFIDQAVEAMATTKATNDQESAQAKAVADKLSKLIEV